MRFKPFKNSKLTHRKLNDFINVELDDVAVVGNFLRGNQLLQSAASQLGLFQEVGISGHGGVSSGRFGRRLDVHDK